MITLLLHLLRVLPFLFGGHRQLALGEPGFAPDRFSRKQRLCARIDCLRAGAGGEREIEEFAGLAKKALDSNKIEQAWWSLLNGEERALQRRSDAELASLAETLSIQSDTLLSSGDAAAVLPLLERLKALRQEPRQDDPQKSRHEKDTAEWRACVIAAHRMVESQLIMAFDARERKSHRTLVLCSALFVGLGIVMFLATCKEPLSPLWSEPNKSISYTWQLLLAVGVLGWLGACVSALIGLAEPGRRVNAFEGTSTIIARILVGAARGLFGAIALGSGVPGIQVKGGIGAVAFSFGFSERLVSSVVPRGKDDKPPIA